MTEPTVTPEPPEALRALIDAVESDYRPSQSRGAATRRAIDTAEAALLEQHVPATVMSDNQTIAFIVDLNEAEGDFIEISMDFTANYGPLVLAPVPQPQLGDRVQLHSPDEDTLFWATVIEQVSARDLRVEVHWDSCTPVLNWEWSAAGQHVPAPTTVYTDADDLVEMAWGLLANVSGGDWSKQTDEWQEAVVRWRDRFNASLAVPAPETVSVQHTAETCPGRPCSDDCDHVEYRVPFAWVAWPDRYVPAPAEPCEFCGGNGVEWKDYWSADAEPCRRGCAVPAPEGTREATGKADWVWYEDLGLHMPCCSQPKGRWRCGNGPLTGDQIESGNCGEPHTPEPVSVPPVEVGRLVRFDEGKATYEVARVSEGRAWLWDIRGNYVGNYPLGSLSDAGPKPEEWEQ